MSIEMYFDEIIKQAYLAKQELSRDKKHKVIFINLDTGQTGKQDIEENPVVKLKKGSITKRKDSRWECKLYVGGKQITTACCRSQKEAIARHNKYIQRLANNGGKLQDNIVDENLSQWITRWLDTYKKNKIKSWNNLERTFRLHMRCPDTLLSKLTEYQLIKLINSGSTARIRVDIYKLLKDCMHRAYVNRLTPFDLSLGLIKPAYIQGEGKAYNNSLADQFRQDMSDTPYGVLIDWYLVTGCRPAELFAIKITDIHLQEGYIHIPGTKNTTSNRNIPIFAKTKQLLRSIDRSKEYLVGNLTYEGLKSAVRRCNASKGTNYKIKDLRTTFATDCANKGISAKVLAKWMGHSKADTTNKYYIKILPEFEQSEVDKFDNN